MRAIRFSNCLADTAELEIRVQGTQNFHVPVKRQGVTSAAQFATYDLERA